MEQSFHCRKETLVSDLSDEASVSRTAASALVLVMALAACGSGPTASRAGTLQSPSTKLRTLEESDAIPTPDRGPSLEGVDANGNGVRDDIDHFIDQSYASRPQQSAARQLAANLQKTLTVDKQDRIALRAVSIAGTRAVHCVYSRFVGENGDKRAGAVVYELEALTANTRPRLMAYLAYNKAMDGTSSSLPEEDTCV